MDLFGIGGGGGYVFGGGLQGNIGNERMNEEGKE